MQLVGPCSRGADQVARQACPFGWTCTLVSNHPSIHAELTDNLPAVHISEYMPHLNL
jgi:hypothetical protein